MRTSETEVVGEYIVVAQSARAPSDDEWRANITRQTSIPVNRARVLVWTDGGAPNAKQRAELTAAYKKSGEPLTAVVTPSSLARMVGTALSWFNPRMRMFAPDELEAALDHLCAEGDTRKRVKETLVRLRRSLDQASRPGADAQSG